MPAGKGTLADVLAFACMVKSASLFFVVTQGLIVKLGSLLSAICHIIMLC